MRIRPLAAAADDLQRSRYKCGRLRRVGKITAAGKGLPLDPWAAVNGCVSCVRLCVSTVSREPAPEIHAPHTRMHTRESECTPVAHETE
jgi:hypothetical protein